MLLARELVEELMPNLVADARFRVVDEDPRKWGYVIYGSERARVVVSVHHSGRTVDVLRNSPMRDVLDSATPVDFYANLERGRPPWAGNLEGALRYLDAHLDDVVRVTATEQEWDRFRADARAVLESTMGN